MRFPDSERHSRFVDGLLPERTLRHNPGCPCSGSISSWRSSPSPYWRRPSISRRSRSFRPGPPHLSHACPCASTSSCPPTTRRAASPRRSAACWRSTTRPIASGSWSSPTTARTAPPNAPRRRAHASSCASEPDRRGKGPRAGLRVRSSGRRGDGRRIRGRGRRHARLRQPAPGLRRPRAGRSPGTSGRLRRPKPRRLVAHAPPAPRVHALPRGPLPGAREARPLLRTAWQRDGLHSGQSWPRSRTTLSRSSRTSSTGSAWVSPATACTTWARHASSARCRRPSAPPAPSALAGRAVDAPWCASTCRRCCDGPFARAASCCSISRWTCSCRRSRRSCWRPRSG